MAYKRNRFGSIVMDGFTITQKEQREYILNVKKSNSKRKYLIDKYYNEVKDSSYMKGISKESFTTTLEQRGFIPEKFTTSFKGITSKKDFKMELQDLKVMTKKDYNESKIDEIKAKMLRQINYNLGKSGEDIYNNISNMSRSEILNLYINSPDDMLAEIYGSDGSYDDEEERAERTRSTIAIVKRNITNKKNRDKRMKELDKEVKRPRRPRGRKKK